MRGRWRREGVGMGEGGGRRGKDQGECRRKEGERIRENKEGRRGRLWKQGIENKKREGYRKEEDKGRGSGREGKARLSRCRGKRGRVSTKKGGYRARKGKQELGGVWCGGGGGWNISQFCHKIPNFSRLLVLVLLKQIPSFEKLCRLSQQASRENSHCSSNLGSLRRYRKIATFQSEKCLLVAGKSKTIAGISVLQ